MSPRASSGPGRDRLRFPVDPWRLIETSPSRGDLGVTETLFAVGNGYVGLRANPTEGREAHSHGTFINGFHETWPIQHAEEAYGFATTGQTIVNAPDAKVMKLYVDDEPLLMGTADTETYERVLDFASGRSWRDLIWRTPSGKRLRVRSTRMASFDHRHLVVLTLDITLLDGDAPIVVSSQILNRQDGEDEYHVPTAALGEGGDPRRSRRFTRRVLDSRLQRRGPGPGPVDELIMGYRCHRSGMTLACGVRHLIEAPGPVALDTEIGPDQAKVVIRLDAQAGSTLRITKLVSYHTSTGVPAEELADRCSRTLERAQALGVERLEADQRAWMDRFWADADVTVDGDDSTQQAVRWHLLQLAQASGSIHEAGIAAKGVTGSGYEGHYFWDTEVYVVPFLARTRPEIARSLLRFRWRLLDDARERARVLGHRGALYPWRTINGQEASSYYAAGTAQYHINAAVAYALEQYTQATGDIDFLAREGAEILVETARLWEDLGFYDHPRPSTDRRDDTGAPEESPRFHIHGVTGPDEYTTVVNDNLYTNVMARSNLQFAARTVRRLAVERPREAEALARRVDLDPAEIEAWERAAAAMYLPFDPIAQIHPQDEAFLAREPWEFDATPVENYPLLLHYHPLVIYRHQVLKQADVVLAMFLRPELFDHGQTRRNFEYYDPLTTGDSSLSAAVQSIVATRIGKTDLAMDYFDQTLRLDLDDLHGNTDQGVHVAASAGVWSALVRGFGGFDDDGERITITPRLPARWPALTFRCRHHATLLEIRVETDATTVTVIDGPPVAVEIASTPVEAAVGNPAVVMTRAGFV